MYGVCVWYVLCIFAVSSESAYHGGGVQFIGDDGLLQPMGLLKYIHISDLTRTIESPDLHAHLNPQRTRMYTTTNMAAHQHRLPDFP